MSKRNEFFEYYGEPRALEYTTDYMKRLLIERHHIYARLTNPGGSVILMGSGFDLERGQEYSTVIGNDFHLDILRMDEVLRRMPADQRLALLAWADGLTPQQAAVFLGARPSALRKRRERGVQRLTKEMSNGGEEPRRAGRRTPSSIRQEARPES